MSMHATTYNNAFKCATKQWSATPFLKVKGNKNKSIFSLSPFPSDYYTVNYTTKQSRNFLSALELFFRKRKKVKIKMVFKQQNVLLRESFRHLALVCHYFFSAVREWYHKAFTEFHFCFLNMFPKKKFRTTRVSSNKMSKWFWHLALVCHCLFSAARAIICSTIKLWTKW